MEARPRHRRGRRRGRARWSPSWPACRCSARRRQRGRPSSSSTAARSAASTPTACCCAAGSGTSSATTTPTTSCGRTASIGSPVTCERVKPACSSGRPGSTCGRRSRSTRSCSEADEDDAVAAVRVGGERAAAVERELGAERVTARLGDGSIEVAVPCANVPAFRSWVLGLLDHAEVVGPPDVRRRRGRVAVAAGGSGVTGTAKRRTAEQRLGRLLVMLPWLMEQRRGAARRGRRPLRADARRGRRRSRAGRDVWAATVRRRDDRRLHRRRHRLRRRARDCSPGRCA